MKVAVITPCYKEPEAVLRRCVDSVRTQLHPATHFLVEDSPGRAHDLDLDGNVRRITLGVPHGDYGNTPRAIGALCALNEGYDIVCFLDADNLFTPEHVSSIVAAFDKGMAEGQPLDAVFAYRHIFLPGYENLRLAEAEDLDHSHVDTSCVALHRRAAFVWPLWGMIPKASSPVCDRVFFGLLQVHQLNFAWTGLHTVLYESNWSSHYKLAGLPMPPDGLHDYDIRGVEISFPEDELWARLRVRP